MTKFIMTELVDTSNVQTARLGTVGVAGQYTDAEVGKFVKLIAESNYGLVAQGDEIEGRISSVEAATMDAFSVGGVMDEGKFAVTFDGLQATPGVGNVAIRDYVVAGTPVAKGTSLSVGGVPAKVAKATAAGNTLNFKWRVVSLGLAGTGAPGTVGLIEQIG